MTIFSDLISVAELKNVIGTSGCRIVDCRHNLFDPDKGRADYLEGHLPAAVFADMDKDLASEVTPVSGRHPLPEVETFRRRLEGWGIGDDTQVVVYDYGNGSLAVRMWWMLRWLGHDAVAILNGGIKAWTDAGEPLEDTVPEYAGATFTASPDNSMIATTAEIESAVKNGEEINLIDARDEARFHGEMEPIDTLAGHIPGASNLPLARNLNEEGRWRGVSELETIWDDFLSGRTGEPLIVMCGSGVTACHLILSARLAGLESPRLYVGSWSEWIRDERRPVVGGK